MYQNLVLAKNKLRKFQQISSYSHVFEPTIEVLNSEYQFKGKWKSEVFKNNNPIILELGCGKGEYSVALAEKYPHKNLIGVDIKGARIWKGATDSLTKNLTNIAFLRVRIEWIEYCFEKNEIDEIWITFPDPQLKFRRSSKRLTHPNFLKKYNKILKKVVLSISKQTISFYMPILWVYLTVSHILLNIHQMTYTVLSIYMSI